MTNWATAGMALFLVAWAAAGIWALWTGLERRRAAAHNARQAARLHLLLESAPALPMMVKVDGRIEAPERLAAWLGLKSMPGFLTELSVGGAGLAKADIDALAEEVLITQRTGREFARPVRAAGSSRTLLIRGGAASRGLSATGGVLLWFFDATESQAEIGKLGEEVGLLRSSYAALSGLIETAPFPIWHRDRDLRLTLVNAAYVAAVDADTAEVVVGDEVELFESIGDQSPLGFAQKARDGGKAISRTSPATIAGTRRMMQVIDVPLGDAGVAGYAFDVADREEALAQLRRFTETQRGMLDQLSAGVAQFSGDRQLTFANQPFQRIFSLQPEWVSEGTEFERVLERMQEANRLPDVRDFPQFKTDKRAWFQATTPPAEESWLLSDGTHLRVLPQPLPDGGVLILFEDRTEEIRLASARDTLLRVRTATFDNLFEAVAVFAADGRLQLWNHRYTDLWGLSEEKLIGSPRLDDHVGGIAELLSDSADADDLQTMLRATTAERAQRVKRLSLKDGRIFEAASVPLPDGNALLTILDISASQEVEQALRERASALEEADKIKTAFVENMSYELRTPLTSIGGFAEMLDEGYAGDLSEQGKDYVAAIRESVATLSTLIDNVLDLSTGAVGQLPPERSSIDLDWLLADLAAGAARDAGLKNIEFEATVAPNIGSIEADVGRLRKAIDHLLDNAVRYTPEKGRVLLHADRSGKTVRIIVSDNGPGMDPKAQAQAFDMFSGIEPVRRGDGALGIGLPLARQIVQAEGGTLTLQSEPGVGTLVMIELPG